MAAANRPARRCSSTAGSAPTAALPAGPVDLEELPDGSLLISDDDAGLIYRVTYQP